MSLAKIANGLLTGSALPNAEGSALPNADLLFEGCISVLKYHLAFRVK
jgi:hypothetical protein